MREPHQTASGVVSESPLVLTDIMLDDGTVGHSLIFTYTAAALEPTATLVRNLEPLIKGDVLAPAETEQKLARRFRLLGAQGLVKDSKAPTAPADLAGAAGAAPAAKAKAEAQMKSVLALRGRLEPSRR